MELDPPIDWQAVRQAALPAAVRLLRDPQMLIDEWVRKLSQQPVPLDFQSCQKAFGEGRGRAAGPTPCALERAACMGLWKGQGCQFRAFP